MTCPNAQAGDYYQLVARDVQREILQIVLTCTADPDEFLAHGSRFRQPNNLQIYLISVRKPRDVSQNRKRQEYSPWEAGVRFFRALVEEGTYENNGPSHRNRGPRRGGGTGIVRDPAECGRRNAMPVAVQPSQTQADENAQPQKPARFQWSTAAGRACVRRDWVVERILKGEFLPKPTTEQMNAFVNENHRSVDSLLGAYGATGDRAYLKEAVTAHPNDPKTLYAAYFFASEYKSEEVATPERRKYLEGLKAADPKNSLPWYLSARDYFKSGQTEKALAELRAASALAGYDYYGLEYMQDTQDAFAAAGHPDVEAKAESTFALPLPHLAQLRDLSRAVVEQANAARQAGDQAAQTTYSRSG